MAKGGISWAPTEIGQKLFPLISKGGELVELVVVRVFSVGNVVARFAMLSGTVPTVGILTASVGIVASIFSVGRVATVFPVGIIAVVLSMSNRGVVTISLIRVRRGTSIFVIGVRLTIVFIRRIAAISSVRRIAAIFFVMNKTIISS